MVDALWKLFYLICGLIMAAIIAGILFGLIDTGLQEYSRGKGGYIYFAIAAAILFGLYKFARSIMSGMAQDKARNVKHKAAMQTYYEPVLNALTEHGLISDSEKARTMGRLQAQKTIDRSFYTVLSSLLYTADDGYDEILKKPLDTIAKRMYVVVGDRDRPIEQIPNTISLKPDGVRPQQIPRLIKAFASYSNGKFDPTDVEYGYKGLKMTLEDGSPFEVDSKSTLGNLDPKLINIIFGLYHARTDETVYTYDRVIRAFAPLMPEQVKALNDAIGEEAFVPYMKERMELRRNNDA